MSVCLFQIQKGKLHGSIDVGLSVMSIKKRARRIDLDTEEHIYHLKVCDLLDLYVQSLKYFGEKQCFFSFRHFYVFGVYLYSFLIFFFSFCYVKVTLNLSWKLFSCLHHLFLMLWTGCLLTLSLSLSPWRWSLQMFLTSGCASCVTIACSVRTRLFALLVMLRYGPSLRLPVQSHPRTPLPAHTKTRSFLSSVCVFMFLSVVIIN